MQRINWIQNQVYIEKFPGKKYYAAIVANYIYTLFSYIQQFKLNDSKEKSLSLALKPHSKPAATTTNLCHKRARNFVYIIIVYGITLTQFAGLQGMRIATMAASTLVYRDTMAWQTFWAQRPRSFWPISERESAHKGRLFHYQVCL